MTDLNVKFKTLKFLGDNVGEDLDDCRFDDDFVETYQRYYSWKKIHKLNFIETKNLCSARDTVKRMERQPIITEVYTYTHTYKSYIYIYLLLKLNNKKKNKSIKKWPKTFTSHERRCINDKYIKSCSIPYAIMGLQIKTT